MDQMTGGKCRCFHHNMTGIWLLLLGVLFLLGNLEVFSAGFVDIAWPILLGLAGLTKMFAGKCKCCVAVES